MYVCVRECVWFCVQAFLGVFAFYAVLFAFLFVLPRALCVFSLFHYLVYLSLLMTFKWHLLSAWNAGEKGGGKENKERERAMNGNRKATHTHSHTYNSISRASKFVESCCQATNLSDSICQLPHWCIINTIIVIIIIIIIRKPQEMTKKRKSQSNQNQNSLFGNTNTLQGWDWLSSFLFSGKRNEPLENSSTALEHWGPLSLKISLKKTKHNRQSHRVQLMGSVCFEIAAQAPDWGTDTDRVATQL